MRIINSRIDIQEKGSAGELILKACIGAAFQRYVIASYKNFDKIEKMKAKELMEEKYHTSITLNSLSDQSISEEHLKKYFEKKFDVPVSISISMDKPIITFSKDILKNDLIKSCFKLGCKNRSKSLYQNRERFDRSRGNNDYNDNRRINLDKFRNFKEL